MTELTPEQQALQEKLKNMSPEELKEFQKQQCIFCQIVSGKVPAKKVYEDDFVMAILDINPAAKGHMLLLPKEHYAIMPQIPESLLGKLFVVAKQLSQKLLQQLKAQGTSIFMANGLAAGQRAQHFMIHIIPRKTGDGLLMMNEKLIAPEMLQHIETAVKPALYQQLGLEVPKTEEEEPEEEEDSDVNLDDIAGLFK